MGSRKVRPGTARIAVPFKYAYDLICLRSRCGLLALTGLVPVIQWRKGLRGLFSFLLLDVAGVIEGYWMVCSWFVCISMC